MWYLSTFLNSVFLAVSEGLWCSELLLCFHGAPALIGCPSHRLAGQLELVYSFTKNTSLYAFGSVHNSPVVWNPFPSVSVSRPHSLGFGGLVLSPVPVYSPYSLESPGLVHIGNCW